MHSLSSAPLVRVSSVKLTRIVLMFGLFDDIPKPVAEVWTKRRPEWMVEVPEVLQYVTDIPDDVSGEEAKKLGW